MGQRTIEGQTITMFRSSLAIGQSRHEAKQKLRMQGQHPQSMLPRIYSWRTYHRMLTSARLFTAWCLQESAIQLLRDITPQMVRDYLTMRKTKISANTLATDLAGIRRLNVAMLREGWI